MPYPTSQPITDEGYKAFFADCLANPKPHLSVQSGRTRLMSAEIMGEWMLARPGCTEDHLAAEFTADERKRFSEAAKDYAIRKSGDVH